MSQEACRRVVREAEAAERPLLANKKWLLLSHRERLGAEAEAELEELLALNRPLAIAHLLKEIPGDLRAAR